MQVAARFAVILFNSFNIEMLFIMAKPYKAFSARHLLTVQYILI